MPRGKKSSRGSGKGKTPSHPLRLVVSRKETLPRELRVLPQLSAVKLRIIASKLRLSPKVMESIVQRAPRVAFHAAVEFEIWGKLDAVQKKQLVSIVEKYMVAKREYSEFLYPRLQRFGSHEMNWPENDFIALLYSLQKVEKNKKEIAQCSLTVVDHFLFMHSKKF